MDVKKPPDKRQQNLQILLDKISTYSHDLWNPIGNNKIKNIETNSWFTLSKVTNDNKRNKNKYVYETDTLEKVTYKCIKKIILPDHKQKEILLQWMNAYTKMYNETVRVIESKCYMTKTERKMDNTLKRNEKQLLNNLNIYENKSVRDIKCKFKAIIQEYNKSIMNLNIKKKQRISAEKVKLKTKLSKSQKDIINENIKRISNEYNSKIHNLTQKLSDIKIKNKTEQKEELVELKEECKIKCREIKAKRNHIKIDFERIRTDDMKEIKDKIKREVNNTIPSHTLDLAIKDCCTSYASALTNLINGNIKHFRIRYIKQSKKKKIIKLEASSFGKNTKTFCSSVFGDKMKTNDNSDFRDVKCGATISYDTLTNRFTMFIPVKIVNNDNLKTNKNEAIGLDIGVKTFAEGYSNNHNIIIGNGLTDEIKVILNKIDKINSSELSNNRKRKAVNKRYIKIGNMMDDLHWKTIKYLTDHYDTIIIGNLSTKSIVQSDKLNKITKRVAMLMKLFVFKERLKFKCSLKDCQYKHINEQYTTKTCSYCGNMNEHIGGKRVYNCENCGKIIGRDLNGAKNIFTRAIEEIQY
jgi:transposase